MKVNFDSNKVQLLKETRLFIVEVLYVPAILIAGCIIYHNHRKEAKNRASNDDDNDYIDADVVDS